MPYKWGDPNYLENWDDPPSTAIAGVIRRRSRDRAGYFLLGGSLHLVSS